MITQYLSNALSHSLPLKIQNRLALKRNYHNFAIIMVFILYSVSYKIDGREKTKYFNDEYYIKIKKERSQHGIQTKIIQEKRSKGGGKQIAEICCVRAEENDQMIGYEFLKHSETVHSVKQK